MRNQISACQPEHTRGEQHRLRYNVAQPRQNSVPAATMVRSVPKWAAHPGVCWGAQPAPLTECPFFHMYALNLAFTKSSSRWSNCSGKWQRRGAVGKGGVVLRVRAREETEMKEDTVMRRDK